MRKTLVLLSVLCVLAVGLVPAGAMAAGVRIKDVAKVQGVRSNQLVGYGLVIGLAGTGDSTKNLATMQSIANMLRTFGVTVTPAQLQAKNVAAVMVTASLPPFVKPGDTIDITVSSLGDAKSLQGGTLLQAPLRAANGLVYAVAQGPLSVGGYTAGSGGASQQKNFPTVGTIPGGAIVERDVPVEFTAGGQIALALSQPDFTTASRIVQAIDGRFGPIAVARDPGTVTVSVPDFYGSDIVGFIAAIEELTIVPDTAAKVIINERTGTVVMGGQVTIDEVAVAQGGLSVRITRDKAVSQPPPLSGGSTVVTDKTTLQVDEAKASMVTLPPAASVSDVVAALNAIGATPRDIIAILQAIKAAGALHADLQII
ncbi:flagellar basal body P-ring protein FlgI [Sporolituus thermophilus]|uniref:Flagellar P-ring protein n=1 Tax=Sporolituus thermophilus DSM 23256 TaxID=1123285 RepID=A0A1G7HFV2_9FIRM|nr:flagellar basal body P-ring protein FlgI [Sporolituus thermophilus]SDE99350.1 flagellar P-ring protein precursor FlgI [Sporolituus thermophilus DSM 23256]